MNAKTEHHGYIPSCWLSSPNITQHPRTVPKPRGVLCLGNLDFPQNQTVNIIDNFYLYLVRGHLLIPIQKLAVSP